MKERYIFLFALCSHFHLCTVSLADVSFYFYDNNSHYFRPCLVYLQYFIPNLVLSEGQNLCGVISFPYCGILFLHISLSLFCDSFSSGIHTANNPGKLDILVWEVKARDKVWNSPSENWSICYLPCWESTAEKGTCTAVILSSSQLCQRRSKRWVRKVGSSTLSVFPGASGYLKSTDRGWDY